MTVDESRCYRCKRPTPEGLPPSDWEPHVDDDGEVLGVICPDCLTDEEQGAIEDDALTMETATHTCAGCGTLAPDFADGDPNDADYGDPGRKGWYVVDRGLICPSCVTGEEIIESHEALLRGLSTLRGEDDV